MGIAYFSVGRVRQPYVKNSLDTAETAIPLNWCFYWFLSISYAYGHHFYLKGRYFEALVPTYQMRNLVFVPFRIFFRAWKSIENFFCSRAMVTWLAIRSQKISNIHKRICQLSLFFRVFLNIFGRKWENLLFSIFFRSIQLLIFIFFFHESVSDMTK